MYNAMNIIYRVYSTAYFVNYSFHVLQTDTREKTKQFWGCALKFYMQIYRYVLVLN